MAHIYAGLPIDLKNIVDVYLDTYIYENIHKPYQTTSINILNRECKEYFRNKHDDDIPPLCIKNKNTGEWDNLNTMTFGQYWLAVVLHRR
jgi:hypothetical protein